MRRSLGFVLTAALMLGACSGGKEAPASAVRELKDPRTVPTATVPSAIPTYQAAVVEAGQAPRRPTSTPDTYTVKEGDTPAGIAASLGVELNELLRLNNISDPTSLKVGQTLKVPRPPATATPTRTATAAGTARTGASPTGTVRPGTTPTGTVRPGTTPTRAAATATATATATGPSTYTVVEGDTGCGIAIKLGVPLAALAQANSTTPQGLASLRIGQSLQVPSTRGEPGC